jgi:hypothetical protein
MKEVCPSPADRHPFTSTTAGAAVTTSRLSRPTAAGALVSPIVDYEPAPVAVPAPCPAPTSAALHRSTPRPLLRAPTADRPARELPPPRAAAVFADAALRRVLEVTDRRRPAAALKSFVTPSLTDAIRALGPFREGVAVLKRVRVRTATVTDGEASAAEVFGTYLRGERVHAVAGRIEIVDGRWRMVALQLG